MRNPMKKLRLLLSVAMVSLALGACSSSPMGVDDCDPNNPECSLHNPGTGSLHNPGTGSIHNPGTGSLHNPGTGSLHNPGTGS